MTKVVNIRYSAYDVYIGRPGKGETGDFGNPVVKGRPCPLCGGVHCTAGETLPCFEKYARARLASDPAWADAVRGLRGKVLGCFCKDRDGIGDCHGDVYVKLLGELQ